MAGAPTGSVAGEGQLAYDSTGNALYLHVGTGTWQQLGIAGTPTIQQVLTAGNIASDGTSMIFGSGSDFTISHSGALATMANITGGLTISNSGGDITLDNTTATGATIAKLGTLTSATSFQVQDSGATALLTVDGSGQATFSGNVDALLGLDVAADNQSLTVGAGADFSISHDGTNTQPQVPRVISS